MKKVKQQNLKKERRARRARAKIYGNAQTPRMSIFKSNKYTYVQLINDATGKTVASASTWAKKKEVKKGVDALGETIAQKAKEKGINSAVFDRGQHKYHGKIKQVAEAARKAGLKI